MLGGQAADARRIIHHKERREHKETEFTFPCAAAREDARPPDVETVLDFTDL
jgi:hypothetical protein